MSLAPNVTKQFLFHGRARRGVALLIVLLLITLDSAWARQNSTPEERQKIVQLSKQYEKNILAPGAKEIASQVLEWWIEVPDVTLNWCPSLLTDEMPQGQELAEAVLLEGLAAAGVFVLENPKRASDDRASWIAGLEGVVRAYQNLLELDEGHRDHFLDKLVKIQSSGRLGEYVDKHSEECSELDSPDKRERASTRSIAPRTLRAV